MRVLHLSTWDVPCGIATYCGNLVRALDALDIRSDVYPLQPHRWRTYTAGDVAELQADIARHAVAHGGVGRVHEAAAVFHDKSGVAEFLDVGQRFKERGGFRNKVRHCQAIVSQARQPNQPKIYAFPISRRQRCGQFQSQFQR